MAEHQASEFDDATQAAIAFVDGWVWPSRWVGY
jgi:hypothetical protein